MGSASAPPAGLCGLIEEPLWSWNGGIGFKAPPIAYAVDGKEYIAIIAGRNGLPELRMTTGAMLWVFSL